MIRKSNYEILDGLFPGGGGLRGREEGGRWRGKGGTVTCRHGTVHLGVRTVHIQDRKQLSESKITIPRIYCTILVQSYCTPKANDRSTQRYFVGRELLCTVDRSHETHRDKA